MLGGDVSDFLHNIKQENNIGKGLAYHNQSIRERLIKADINPDVALSYRKILNFKIDPSNTENNGNQDIILQVLANYICELKKTVKEVKEIDLPKFSKLLFFVDSLENESKKLTNFSSIKAKNLELIQFR